MNTSSSNTHPEYYTIRLGGHLTASWADWFEGITISETETGETTLSGPIMDQAMLHGIFAKIRDLNLTIISVARAEGEPAQRDGA